MGQVHDDFKETVRSRTDIVALIGESVSLRPANGGREFVALCPFHDDHNPSMRVYPQRQSFRCWVCDEGGDCFAFVMKHDKVGFREALEILAKRANLPLPADFHKRDGQSSDDKTSLFDVAAWAEQQFHECLLRDPQAEKARDYLMGERSLTKATIEQFKLGYHPPHSQWLIQRAAKKFSLPQLAAVWVVKEDEQRGGYYDLFRDRIIYPIRDTQGRPVAFGGRVLPGTEHSGGKYINSADTPIFHKSNLVYGLDQARLAIRDAKCAVLVEGYMDVIACHQAGVRNVVAGLGTALGESHVTLLKRFTDRVILLLDGDEAGQMATDRALRHFLAQGVDLRVLSLPDELDPDEYLLTHGVEAFQGLIKAAIDAWDHKLRTALGRHGAETIIGRQRVLEEMLDILSEMTASASSNATSSWTLRESIMVTRLVQQLGVKETDLRHQLDELRGRKAGQNVKKPPVSTVSVAEPAERKEVFPSKPTADDKAERDLLCIVIAAPDHWPKLRSVLSTPEFRNRNLARLFDVCLSVAAQGSPPSYERVTLATDDPDLKRLAAFLVEQADKVKIGPELVDQTIVYLKRRRELTEGSRPLQGPHAPGTDVHLAVLSTDALDRLRQATLLHQKRAGKPT